MSGRNQNHQAGRVVRNSVEKSSQASPFAQKYRPMQERNECDQHITDQEDDAFFSGPHPHI